MSSLNYESPSNNPASGSLRRSKAASDDGVGVSPHDAWIFAALRAGRTLNGEIDRVSDTYKLVARKLGATPVDDRGSVWQLILGLMPSDEADALVESVAQANPDEPPPDKEPWPPLRLGELPPVPDFPLDVLPVDTARLASEAAGAVGCDPGLVAGPILATAGGLVGRSVSLQLGSNWFAQPCVFQVNVALPGDGKTPGQEYATAPVREIDRLLAQAFEVYKEAHRAAVDEYEQAKKQKGTAASKPKPPVPRRVCMDDVTLEAAFRVLAGNPHGSLMIRDELSALILGLNQYKGGGGSDRPNLLKVWSGQSVLIDRVLNEFNEPIRIPHPFLCITGNLPPGMLPELVNRRGDDGLVDRWLYIFPDRRPKLKSSARRPVSNEAVRLWSDTAMRLWDRPMDEYEGSPCPHVVYFGNAAKLEFDRLHDAHVDEVNSPDFPDILRGPWSKLEAYSGRLCLILTMLRHAADPTADQALLPMVGVREAQDAWRLVDYFKAHHRRVRAYLEGKGLGGAPEGARLILRWLRNHPHIDILPESSLTQDIPRFRKDAAALEDGLLWLTQKKAIRRVADPERSKGTRGRKPAPKWEVHPSLQNSENSENTNNSPIEAFADPKNGNSPNSPNSPNFVLGEREEGGGGGEPSF